MATNSAVDLQSDQLDQDGQQQARDLIHQEKLERRKQGKVLSIPSERLPKNPAPNASGEVVGNIGQTEGQELLEEQREQNNNAQAQTTQTGEAGNYSKEQIRTRLKDRARNALGAKHMGALMALLLSLAVFKDSLDILSISLFSWIDWIFDLMMWILFFIAFGKAPKRIRFEIRVIATIAALIEFVPILDIFTTWTFTVIYAWVRTRNTTQAALQKAESTFREIDKAQKAAKKVKVVIQKFRRSS